VSAPELLDQNWNVDVPPDQVRSARRTVAEYGAREGLSLKELHDLFVMLDLYGEVPA
jgi:hypothetical protein